MPMMWLAPPSTAPRMAAAPTPPTPITATESPGCVRATLSTAPTPVDTPHEINAAVSGSRSFGTTATLTAGVTVCALKLPSPRVVAMSVPSAPCMRKRVVGERAVGVGARACRTSSARGGSCRTSRTGPRTGARPGRRPRCRRRRARPARRSPRPRARTPRGPRWGSGRGARGGRIRTGPAAVIRIRTSPALGSSSSMVSIERGWWSSRITAAVVCTGATLSWGDAT